MAERTTILVADDDPMMLEITSMILRRSGYKVFTAKDGEAALKIFEEAKEPVQLIISDVVMPGLNGLQLVRSIRNLSESTATLLMSGLLPVLSEADAATICKPFTGEALIAKVQDLLAGCDFVKIQQEQSTVRVSTCQALSLNPSIPEE